MPRKASARIASAALSKTMDRNLRVYSTAALAAGVSVLALAQAAHGEVVVTKKTIPIPYNTFPIVGIDFNHDGINDFSANLNFSAYPLSDWDLFVFPVQSSGGVVTSHNGYASALVRGAKIGPADHFVTGQEHRIEHVHTIDNTYSHHYGRTLRGNWGGNPQNRYLGVKFMIQGKTHYGWIRLTVITEPRNLTATITGYAYETVPNKAITAGTGASPASEIKANNQTQRPDAVSLGMLALGTDGLAIWRRE